jgi:hypothetical protein
MSVSASVQAEGGALAVGVAGRLVPGVEQEEALLALAAGQGVARVHVDAEGAAVDLRRAGLHQLDERMLEPAGLTTALSSAINGFRISGSL